MPVPALKRFLDEQGVRYATITHSPAYTAQEIAQSAHVPGREMAKTVVVRADGKLMMAVLRATDRVDLDLLRGALGATDVALAEEGEFKDRFPGVDPGAMPPFGNLYDMQVVVDQGLSQDEHIAFNAGTHSELIRVGYGDFQRLAQPAVLRFAAD